MKIVFSILFMITAFLTKAQEIRSILIKSPISETEISFQELKKFQIHNLDSLRIYNHAGTYKSTLKGIKGVLLKDVLKNIKFGEESPKVLSEYYLVCRATDGFKVVFSWNEVFNNPSGDAVFLMTEVNGSETITQPEGISVISAQDIATGRRYVKQLETIEIIRAK